MSAKGKVYGPCSKKQQLVLLENNVDILLTGGGELCASTVKTIL